ncbi:hypothetical protein DSECCO2_340180 [anaerobic digester metagenome]
MNNDQIGILSCFLDDRQHIGESGFVGTGLMIGGITPLITDIGHPDRCYDKAIVIFIMDLSGLEFVQSAADGGSFSFCKGVQRFGESGYPVVHEVIVGQVHGCKPNRGQVGGNIGPGMKVNAFIRQFIL